MSTKDSPPKVADLVNRLREGCLRGGYSPNGTRERRAKSLARALRQLRRGKIGSTEHA